LFLLLVYIKYIKISKLYIHMTIMNIYTNNINYLINKHNLIKKKNTLCYKLPFDIIQKFFSKKNIDINRLKINYLFLLTLGMITYNRYIL
jgi:hypothetical protein